jgi:FMN-dependent NADH-azoreductase
MNVLLINSSSDLSDNSTSRKLTKEIVTKLKNAFTEIAVSERDVAQDIIPHLDHNTIAAFYSPEEQYSDDMMRADIRSREIIDEFKNADIVVLGAPMYNFSIPSTLRSYFDNLLRVGHTFEFTENGPMGLVDEKKVIVAITRGSEYAGNQENYQEPYLSTLFSFIGINDISYVVAEGLAIPDKKESSIKQAKNVISEIIGMLQQNIPLPTS